MDDIVERRGADARGCASNNDSAADQQRGNKERYAAASVQRLNARRYSAFVSYCHADMAAAQWAQRALETYRLPMSITPPTNAPVRDRRLTPVFRDKDELGAAADLSEAIRAALADCAALIVVCSPAAAASRWVDREIQAYKKANGDDRIFAILTDGDPARPETCFPPSLLRKTGPDGALTDAQIEPIAVDLRAGGDGRRLARQKLVAGVIGLPLARIRDREQARARGRLTAVAAASLVGAFAASALALAAVKARGEAERQAERARAAAATSARATEFMVDLFDVADPINSDGRAIPVTDILKAGVANIETSLEDDPAVRGALLHTMGRAHINLGLYGEAIHLLDMALTVRTPLDDEEATFETKAALATAHVMRADTGENDLDRAEALLAYDPADHGDRPAPQSMELSRGYLQLSQGTYEAALETFTALRERTDNARRLSAKKAAELQLGIAKSLAYQGDHDAAIEQYRLARRQFSEKYGEDNFRLAEIHNDIGAISYFNRDLLTAKEAFSTSLLIYNRVLGENHPETATILNNLARIQIEMGDNYDALEKLERSIFISENSRASFDGRLSALQHNNIAVALWETGDRDKSLLHLEKAKSALMHQSVSMAGEIFINTARAYCFKGNVNAGFMQLERARDELGNQFSPDDWRFDVADEVEALCRFLRGEESNASKLLEEAETNLAAKLGKTHAFTVRARRTRDAASQGDLEIAQQFSN